VRFLFWIALAGVVCAQELKVDHVTVAGRDLRGMQKALESAGLKAEYGGPHSNHATEMALVSFPDGSYLELIAIQPNADPKAVAAHEWRKFLEGDAGPTSWAVRPADFPAEVERLRKTGAAVSGTRPNGRRRPDGVELKWETAQVGPGNGTFFPFLIHDFTPRERRAYPSGKPTTNEWTGINKVVIGVKDLDESVRRFQSVYGFGAPKRQEDSAFGARLAWFEGTPVVLAAPLSAQSWLNERIERFGDLPCGYLLGLNHVVDVHPSTWFGRRVVWFDSSKLGWHLGFEAK
jgi:hypothetical protein